MRGALPFSRPAACTETMPAQRVELYQRITDTIIGELDAGRIPGVQLSSTLPGTAAVEMPRNRMDRRAHSGANVLLPWSAGMELRYHPR
ncbi:hypothetical protein PUR29_31150 [Methylobacterium ajmalii]|uniref:N-terminal domain-containing protein n=1 Tax=Methylobacterium ajmalii TaxID=2738439 RepID=A0ABV0A3M7_9HYPH